MTTRPSDPINPDHYRGHPSGVECITVTEWMNFNLGNATKYIWRAGEKGDAIEDLKKAAWYVQREIERLEDASQDGPTWEFHQYGGGLIAKRVNQ